MRIGWMRAGLALFVGAAVSASVVVHPGSLVLAVDTTVSGVDTTLPGVASGVVGSDDGVVAPVSLSWDASTGASGAGTTLADDRSDRRCRVTGSGQAVCLAEFDEAGRMAARTDAAGTSTFTYNQRGQLASVVDPLTGTTRTHSFDAAGQLSTVNYDDGSATSSRTLQYDDLGRLTNDTLSAGPATVASHAYGYDVDGNTVSKTVGLSGNSASGTHTYTYDRSGRVSSWTDQAANVSGYEFDGAGNLINNAGIVQAFDERNRLVTAGTTNYTYTPRGSLLETTDGATVGTYVFDALGRAASTPAGAFAYDSLDRIASAGSTAFGFAGFEIDPVQIDDTVIARSPSGTPIASQTGSASPTLFGRNAHGDISYLHDAAGVVSSTIVYDPYGAPVGTTGVTPTLGFQGDYTDPTTGDVWMGARWYRPGTGTFVSRDTVFGQLQTPMSLNRYTYAWGDPLGMWDPDGRSPEDFQDVDFSNNDCSGFGDDLRTACEQSSDPAHGGTMICYGVDNCIKGDLGSQLDHYSEARAKYDRMALPSYAKTVYNFTAGFLSAPIRAVESGIYTLEHPLETAKGLRHAVTNPIETGQAIWASCTSSAGAGGACLGDLGLGIITGSATTRALAPLRNRLPNLPEVVDHVRAHAGELGARARQAGSNVAATTRRAVNEAKQIRIEVDLGQLNIGGSVKFVKKAPRGTPGNGPDFVAGPIGSQPPVPVSQSRMASGLEDAGFSPAQTRAPGSQYTFADGSTVRLMEPSGPAGRRASFENAKGGPVNLFTGKPPLNPPPGLTRAERLEWVRNQTHVDQSA